MVKRMLIDASHPEETRVVVLNGNRLEEFDYESAGRTQLKGNIYLAKVTRVEPSLQAAFVEYGGNRHGFLPFSEIHPDYYRIPIADREALIAEEARYARETSSDEPEQDAGTSEKAAEDDGSETGNAEASADGEAAEGKVEEVEVEDRVDVVGGDEVEDDARKRARLMRRYKIQEVIKRRQVMLVQVSKEERGNKGAALTTYLSLAGRYCVLMPNTGRGGGISRKIGSASDRRRLKQVVSELDIPDGMAVIVRTAGSERSKVEIRRDYDYLMRLWNEIRENTLQSTAPALIHEEANLIKRAIRDLYSRDMEEILVEGETGHKTAKAFMKSLTPSHAKKVQFYNDETVPLYFRYKVESQVDAMHSQSVQLKSGGYIVINPTEALVAIDVNSGKATRERHIEETALKTNIEAAEEIARQLRLRDLAGLIVIDFIDMEESRHNRDVERRFKDAMRHDRARIQFGRISPFGLLEMSRQRLRPSLFESSTVPCGRCGGTGHIRSTDTAALQVLRAAEEEGIRRGGGTVTITLPTTVALYILNEKRGRLIDMEQRYGLAIQVDRDDTLVAPDYRLERLSSTGAQAVVPDVPDLAEPAEADEDGRKRRGRRRRRRKDGTEDAYGEAPARSVAVEDREPEEDVEAVQGEAESPAEAEADDERHKPRRRRGKRGGRRRSRRQRDGEDITAEAATATDDGEAEDDTVPAEAAAAESTAEDTASEAADGPVEIAAESGTEAEAEAEAEPAKPRKPRRRTTRRKPAAEAAETAGSETPESEAPEPESPAPDSEATIDGEAPAAKPKRRRVKSAAAEGRTKSPRTRRKKPVADQAEAKTDGAAEPGEAPALESDPAPAAAEPETDDRAAATSPEPAAPPQDSLPPDEAPAFDRAAAAVDPQESDRPKRRGWWQKWV